jgi:hypothetical protein
MGMSGCFAAVEPATLEKLLKKPTLIEGYLNPKGGKGEPPNIVDVDKAWHGIHYLLTGEEAGGEEPYSLVVFGGKAIGPELGYGPARFLTPEQVKQIAKALSRVTEKALKKRFDPEDMEEKEIYPEDIWVEEGQDALEYVLNGYRQVVEFYQEAAKRGDGALLWIC